MNPNNCETCGHKARPEGGHCYMFKNEPNDVCMRHTRGGTLNSLARVMNGLPSGELGLYTMSEGTGKTKFK